jgi:hypothetical protein
MVVYKNMGRYAIATFLALIVASLSFAQDGGSLPTEKEKEDPGKVKFNGLGRVILQQSGIDGAILDNDTTTARNTTDGEFLLDLKINANPNDKTEVQSILRLRNEFGGFFGAGQSIEVRELWARGIIANAIEYRVGDMDIVMSPYTFNLADEEGTVFEPAAFQPQKDVIYYEQFYGPNNERRMQGADLNFGLNFTKILYDMDFRGFMARVRGTDFFTIPTRWVSGGSIKFSTEQFGDSINARGNFGFNIVHTFDDLQSGEATAGIRNTVYTFDYDVIAFENKRYAFHILGEAGKSDLISKDDTATFYTSDDTFLDIALKVDFKPQNLSVSAGFVNVGPEFFSIGAQSKRVDFEAEKTYYDRAGADQRRRQVTLFDLTRDRSIYTFELSDRLMPYDPRFTNALPYGKATPNRRGATLAAEYGNDEKKFEAQFDGAFLQEIRGQGTTELKNFTLLQVAAGLNIHRFLDWENQLRFTLGYKFEQTDRGGVEVEQVDLQSNLLDIGLEAELFRNFELLVGAKILQAEGSDYIPRVDEFNIVTDFPGRYVVDDTETLLAGGVRYNFKKDIYLTLQYHSFAAQRNTDDFRNYRLDQVFLLYTMKF